MRSAVLFLVFNRPATTRQVFEAIAAARPPRLYVAADGPRAGRPGETELCAEVRRIATAVDWPCEVRTLFREENLGCRRAVSGGINWFFEQEEEGIIIEDDVLPVPSFFDYCDELLERYRTDERVGTICGTNLTSNPVDPQASYTFSRYSSVWGWASWRRVWRHYDVEMKSWPEWRDSGGLAKLFSHDHRVADYFRFYFNQTIEHGVNTWDYQLSFLCLRLGLLNAVPVRNQIGNLGVGIAGAHSTEGAAVPAFILDAPPLLLDFPLRHPPVVAQDLALDDLVDQHVHHMPPSFFWKRRLRSIPVLGSLLGRGWDLIKGRTH